HVSTDCLKSPGNGAFLSEMVAKTGGGLVEKGLTYRPLEPGMGEAVAARTILRTTDGRQETWGEVADRVAFGNTSLAWDHHEPDEVMEEYRRLRDHIAFGRVL